MTTQIETQRSKDQILVPRSSYVIGKEFYVNRTDKALEALQEAGYSPVFMPQLIDARIEAPENSRLWNTWFIIPSVRATGKTKLGSKVVVYAHTNNYFSDPKNIKKALDTGLINQAGILPKNEFQRLVDLDGSADEQGNRLIWVIDYDTLRKSSSGVIPVERALKHPQTIPFIGGEERAQRYLERHKKVYGDKIGIWHSDDLYKDGETPLGRLLFVGDDYGDLSDLNYLYFGARLVGVRDGAEGAQKISGPSLEQILNALEGECIPKSDLETARSRLKPLYK